MGSSCNGSKPPRVVALKNPQPINANNAFDALWANAVLDYAPVAELVAVN